MKKRCPWPGENMLMIQYHDTEWGVPRHDDKMLFEYLLLDTFQAGLSWAIILNKRENFRKAFSNFNPKQIAKFNTTKEKALLHDKSIVRNKLKIASAIQNANAYLDIQREFNSFSSYLWKFVNHTPILNKRKSTAEIPTKTKLSDKISKDLKYRGFKFVGSTTIYAFLQGAGVINDHLVCCFRHKECSSNNLLKS